jgi:hypothetical protein
MYEPIHNNSYMFEAGADREKHLKQEMYVQFSKCAKQRVYFDNIWKRALDAFHHRFNLSKHPSQSRIWYPLTKQVIMASKARLFSMVPEINTEPKNPHSYTYDRDLLVARAIDVLLKNIMSDNHSRYLRTMVEMSFDISCLGHGICRVDYDVKKRRVNRSVLAGIDYIKEQFIYEKQPIEIIDYNGPKIDYIPLPNVWVDISKGGSIQEMPYIFHACVKSYDDLVSEGIYDKEKLDKVRKNAKQYGASVTNAVPISSSGGNSVTGDKNQRDFLTSIGLDFDELDDDEFYIMTRYSPKEIVACINFEEIIMIRDNPFDDDRIPFLDFANHIIPGKFYGMGDFEPISGLQGGINALINMMLERIHLMLHPVFMYREDAIDPHHLYGRAPGVGIPVHTGREFDQVVKELSINPNGADAFWMFNVFDMAAQQTSFVDNTMKGTAGGDKIATAVMRAQQSADFSFSERQGRFELLFLNELTKFMLERTAQNVHEGLPVNIPMSDGMMEVMLDAQLLGTEWKHNIEAGSTSASVKTDRMERVNNLLTVSKDPLIGQTIKPGKLAERVMTLLDVRNPDELIKSEDDMMLEQIMALEQSQQAQGGQQGVSALAVQQQQ